MTVIAKLFMNGRSQAIRLPARLRLQGTEVLIEPAGTGFWVQPRFQAPADMAAWLRDFYLTTEALPEDFLIDRADTPAQERDWS
ncbi:MAG: AbrB/MazE/SpoVT family DNA-binding domain-containing protein [Chromatiaceae bacterium]